MELLKMLYSIHSPSGGEDRMRAFIRAYVKYYVKNVDIYEDKGNMYLTKGTCDTYPCVAAHLDQVQKIHPNDFTTISSDGVLFGYSPSEKRQCGLGADDKNGIWVALKCLEKYDAIKVALFCEEETGTVGSSRADMQFFEDCRFVVQCDRKGGNDFITSSSWEELCDEDFYNLSHAEEFGYVPESGFLTDVATLKENGLNVACCNLSCGYYEPHTDCEFTIFPELENCYNLVCYMIENITSVVEHVQTVYSYHRNKYYDYGYGYGSYYDDYDDGYDLFDDESATKEDKIRRDIEKCITYYGVDSFKSYWRMRSVKYSRKECRKVWDEYTLA